MFYALSWLVIAPVVRALWRLRVQGRTYVPKKGAAIIASNHLSFLDHLLVGAAVKRQIFFISKIEHFERPFRRFLFQRWGVIPLRRGASDAEAFDRSVEVLQQGKLFCIYPEGTRSLDGKLHRGHTGVARLAAITKVPVVPAAMIGTFEAMPKGQSRPNLSKCAVRFGAPIDLAEFHGRDDDRDAMRAATDRVMQAIRALSGQEYVDEYQRNPEILTHREPAARPG